MSQIKPDRKTLQWILFSIVLLQPLFDVITNWLLLMNCINYISYLRAGLIILFGISVILYCPKHRAYAIISFCWAVYVAARYLLAEMLLPGTGMAETENAFRVMVLPLFTLWLVWLVNEETEATLDTIWRGALLSMAIIVVSSLISLLTDTYTRTYSYQLTADSAMVKIGFSGWSYSANAQSIILVVLFGLLSAPALRSEKAWVLFAYGISFWLLMYFNGTRTAYYGMLIIPCAILALLVFRQLILKVEHYKWTSYAVFAAFLLLAVVLKPYSILTIVNTSRQGIINIVSGVADSLQPTQLNTGTPAPSAAATNVVESPSAEAVATPSSNPVLPSSPGIGSDAGMPKWEVDFGNTASWFIIDANEIKRINDLRAATRYDSRRLDDSVYEYLSQRSKLTTQQLVDVRQRQSSFIMAFMHHADPLRILTGFGKTWFIRTLQSVESDYAAIYGYYGVLGCVLLFGIIIYVLLMIGRRVDIRKLKRYCTIEIVMSSLTIVLLLVLAKYSGRVFQQASVSFYLSLSLAILYGSVTAQQKEIKGCDQ